MTVRPLIQLPGPRALRDVKAVERYVADLARPLDMMRQGKLECVAEFTLTANVATTVLSDTRLSPQSVVMFDPKTANAATEKAAGTIYVLTANRGNEAWTVTHANNAQADRLFQVSIIG